MIDIRTRIKNFATEYTINLLVLKWRGEGWAIYRKNDFTCCYDKMLKEFVYEPMPSSRTELFFEACRFEMEEAISLIKEFDPTARI